MNLIKLTTNHQSKVLKMFEFYYTDKITTSLNIDENGLLHFSDIENPIHWYELVFNILHRKIFNNNFYWTNVFVIKCVQYYSPIQEHPVDFLYDFYLKAINNEPFFKVTENQFVLENEEKENKKSQKAMEKKKILKEEKKNLVEEKKFSKKEKKETLIEEKKINNTKNSKPINEDDFF